MSFGVQVGDVPATARRRGIPEASRRHDQVSPARAFPGIDYSAFAIDPDGHAMQLYYYMEQIGWDGKPRPASRASAGR